MSKRQKLGELLISLGVIDAMQLQSALGHQRQWGVPLGRALVEKRFCSEDQILAALAKQTGVATIQIDLAALDPSLSSRLPQRMAEQLRAVPLRLEGARNDVLVVALGGPANLASVDQVRSASGIPRIIPYLAKDSDIDRALDVIYRGMAPPTPTPVPGTVTFDALPPPGAHLQGESEFDFGDDALGQQDFVGNRADEAALSQGPAGAVQTSALDELLGIGAPDSAGLLQRPEPPSTPPAPPVDPLTKLQPPPLPRAMVPPAPVTAPPLPKPAGPAPVIVYGWPLAAAELLKNTLATGGVTVRIVEASEPLASTADDVIIAPLPLIEAVVAKRQSQLPGSVIVAVKTPESDLHRAQRVGAKGYLATPVDGELLLRAVKRCRKG